MNSPITIESYEELALYCEDQELNSIWLGLGRDFANFDERREAFFWVLRRLLEEGRIKLVNMRTHIPLEGSVDGQIQRFRDVFPKNDAEMDSGIWFLLEGCPGGSAWLH